MNDWPICQFALLGGMEIEAPSEPLTGADLRARRLAARVPVWAIAIGMRSTRWHVQTIEGLGSGRPARRVVERYLDAIDVVLAVRDGSGDQ